MMTAERQLKTSNNDLSFDVANLPSGLYMVKVTSSLTGETVYQKFIKY
jgi:hypothetical protein